MAFREAFSSKQPRKNRPNKRGESFGKKAALPKKTPVRRVVVGVLLACVLVLLLVGGRTAVRSVNEWTEIQQLTILGLDHLSREEIIATLDVSPHSSLWSIDTESLSGKLETHPWIRSVTFDRVLPHSLVVEIEERRPAAVLRTAEKTFLVGEEGYLLPGEPGKASKALPELHGLASKFFSRHQEESHRRAKQGIHLAELLSDRFSGRPKVNVSQAHSTVVDFPHIRVQFGQEPEKQWERFLVLYPTVKDTIKRQSQEVDLRFSQKVILRKRTL